ncbi:Ribosomal protein S18 acetylase RimI-like enzyme OS=Ureibacillus acetophenoni OX=614649 GN=SAMN05877842_106201 PE=4 SV=1 [Ureibacillus acetophenoni]
MEIKILTETNAPEYQQLRLRALQTNPESFGSTYDKEVAFTLDYVKERIQPTNEKFVLGAYDDGNLVGIARFVRETDQKVKHKGNIYGMYVAPEMRGRGVGRAILIDMIDRAKKMEGVEQIHLSVVSSNLSAKKLYESLGFKSYGVEPNALKDNGQYYDEDFMVLFID